MSVSCVSNFRLNMSQSFSQSSVKSTPRKRRRGEGSEVHSDFVQETDSKAAYASSGMVLGSMEITEVSEEGKYVKIKNLADEVSLDLCTCKLYSVNGLFQ